MSDKFYSHHSIPSFNNLFILNMSAAYETQTQIVHDDGVDSSNDYSPTYQVKLRHRMRHHYWVGEWSLKRSYRRSKTKPGHSNQYDRSRSTQHISHPVYRKRKKKPWAGERRRVFSWEEELTEERMVMVHSSNPSSRKFLDFKNLEYRRPSGTLDSKLGVIKSMVDRSRGVARHVSLPRCMSDETLSNVLNYISNGCPALKSLSTPRFCEPERFICKWKDLEELTIKHETHCFVKLLAQINTHCKNFSSLKAKEIIWEEEANAIVNFLPKIKQLRLRRCRFKGPECLKIILAGCKELQVLDVSCSIGLKEIDEEILKMASHIKAFVSKYQRDYDYSSDGYSDHVSDWNYSDEDDKM